MLAKLFGEQKDIAVLILRVGFGLVFMAAGYRHAFGNPSGYVGLFTGIGIPAPEIMAPFVAWVELLGGAAALLGLLTRLSGGLLAIVMLVAIIGSRIPATFAPRDGVVPPFNLANLIGNIQAETCLLVIALFLLLMGSGKFGVDRIFSKPSQ